MQTCSVCHTHIPDAALVCPKCQADLFTRSETAQVLRLLQENPRVSMIRVVMAEDACPSCQEHARVYPKDQVPHLPVEGCSHVRGCRCFYEPILTEIYP